MVRASPFFWPCTLKSAYCTFEKDNANPRKPRVVGTGALDQGSGFALAERNVQSALPPSLSLPGKCLAYSIRARSGMLALSISAGISRVLPCAEFCTGSCFPANKGKDLSQNSDKGRTQHPLHGWGIRYKKRQHDCCL